MKTPKNFSMAKLEDSWLNLLADVFETPWFAEIESKIQKEMQYTIYPPVNLLFNAMNLCPVSQTKVVILGQDPYPDPEKGLAHGLSFSVPSGKIPTSLQNIYKELGIEHATHGNLESWAKQGVLLLNSSLSVRAKSPKSHLYIWKEFTDSIIKKLSQNKKNLIAPDKNHLVLEAPHPSSRRGDFIGHGHFSEANKYLKKHGFEPIDWQLP